MREMCAHMYEYVCLCECVIVGWGTKQSKIVPVSLWAQIPLEDIIICLT